VPMRLYVPATLDELTAVVPGPTARWDLAPRAAHAVTPALAAALPEDDDEGHEYAAFLAAADDSLALVAAGGVVPLRVVVSVEVPDDAVSPDDGGADAAPSRVSVGRALSGVVVEAVHVDEPEAAVDVRAVLVAADGDDDDALAAAIERSAERDLLWYAPAEIGAIPRP
jgi:hypothetical protein